MELKINTGLFKASAKTECEIGCKCLFPKRKNSPERDKNKRKQHYKNTEHPEQTQVIPPLHKGQMLSCTSGEVIKKNTSAPKAYTDATLLSAMTGISAHINDAELKKALKDTDGLGTEATRAGIIELLFKRDFLQRQGKNINATRAGKALINALPKVATSPDLTASWESILTAIHEGRASYTQLMNPLEQQIERMVFESQSIIPQGLNVLGKSAFKKRRSNSKKTKNRKKVA